MPIQTIFKAGNSNVVAMPINMMREMQINPGDKVDVTRNDRDNSIVIKKIASSNAKQSQKSANAEFKAWLETFMDENGETLDELAVS